MSFPKEIFKVFRSPDWRWRPQLRARHIVVVHITTLSKTCWTHSVLNTAIMYAFRHLTKSISQVWFWFHTKVYEHTYSMFCIPQLANWDQYLYCVTSSLWYAMTVVWIREMVQHCCCLWENCKNRFLNGKYISVRSKFVSTSSNKTRTYNTLYTGTCVHGSYTPCERLSQVHGINQYWPGMTLTDLLISCSDVKRSETDNSLTFTFSHQLNESTVTQTGTG